MRKKTCIKNVVSLLIVISIVITNSNLAVYASILKDSQSQTSITLSASTAGLKDTITVTVQNGSKDSSAWVGLYNEADTPGDSSSGGVASIWWSYLSDHSADDPSHSLAIQNGNGDFKLNLAPISGLEQGKSYKLLLFKDGGYTVEASANFTISASEVEPDVSLSSSTVALKDTITVTIKNASKDSEAWLGVYNQEDTPGKVDSMFWKYIYGDTKNDPDHSLGFTSPNGEFQLPLDTISGIKQGETYKVVLFKDGGYTVDASSTFYVSAPQAPVHNLEAAEIKTQASTAPTLPATVRKDNSDGTFSEVNVIWDKIPSYLYSKAGSFTVEGTVNGISEKARADVNVVEGEGPLYSFQVFSDTHIVSNLNYIHDKNLDNALKDINKVDPNSSRLIINGDVVDSGLAANWDAFSTIVNSNKHPKIDMALGNHDTWQENSWIDQNEYDISKQNFIKYSGEPNVYYDYWLNDYHYIFLGSEKSDGNSAYFSDTQLKWFQQTIAQDVKNNKPIFVFIHQPLYDTVAGSKPGQMDKNLDQDKEVRDILAKYPQAILFTGHTHWEFGSKDMFYNKSLCTMFNVPSCGYCWTDANAEDDISEGYYIDVYKDKILIKGRNFTKGEWEQDGQYEVDYSGTDTNSSIKILDNYINQQSTAARLDNITLTADKTAMLLDGADKAKTSLKGTMTDGSAADLKKAEIKYSSDNPEIAAVDDTGTITPLAKGTANITARVTVDGITESATQQLQVEKIKTDATLKSITINGKMLKDFAPDTLGYRVLLAPNTVLAPKLEADPTDSDAAVSIKQASNLQDKAVITVTSADKSVTKTYSISFAVDSKATVDQPVFSLDSSKAYTEKQNLAISCDTSNAIIRYTLDGSDPNEKSSIYTGPIELSDTTTVRAIAIKDGLNNSDITSSKYIINLPSGTELIQNGDFSSGASFWQTYNGADNSPAGVDNGEFKTTVGDVGDYYWSVQLSQGNFKLKGGITYRLTFDARSTINRSIEPLVEIPGGGDGNTFLDKVVPITSDMSTYTCDFTVPADVDNAHLVFCMGNVNGMGAVAAHDVYIDNVSLKNLPAITAEPSFSVDRGTYSSELNVAITSASPGAIIRYTTDGTDPTAASPIYSQPIKVSANTTIKAYAAKAGLADSKISAVTYNFSAAAAPKFSISGGSYDSPQQVEIISDTEGAIIRYTTDGTEPNSRSQIYSGPITVAANTIIKAYASKDGHTDSKVVSEEYTIKSTVKQSTDDTNNPPNSSGESTKAAGTNYKKLVQTGSIIDGNLLIAIGTLLIAIGFFTVFKRKGNR
ncbi:chitobiase/beta-hexosaminidase C-terminal domain-containing protein [Clostridium sp. 19966]|uniref:chitobiase/beta-hexosaminidase C-terminal domain-containing protein n=1 Tax=Clostridium sp. 19966 TaxID=2768166 RepID=UPI0028DE8EA4|nr:chitobiase/beta-hexosaminidase C-terminal domain-containing protein [Clostridium sp. 19966]MDT8715771.1 chitobiase/beta-hexosaminidase C-terminal domain-containing protein [Clostridium sp. 19966]